MVVWRVLHVCCGWEYSVLGCHDGKSDSDCQSNYNSDHWNPNELSHSLCWIMIRSRSPIRIRVVGCRFELRFRVEFEFRFEIHSNLDRMSHWNESIYFRSGIGLLWDSISIGELFNKCNLMLISISMYMLTQFTSKLIVQGGGGVLGGCVPVVFMVVVLV